jgi:GGDEF domain-containing protein
LIEEVARDATNGAAFVGHVGGDDFVVVVGPEIAAIVAQAIVERFDKEAPSFYDREESARGYIEVKNRRGELQRFPVLTISVGVATTENRAYQHYAEAVAIATEMKQFTKSAPGSSWAMDRRTD